jgi:hypothetical protein
VTKTRSDAVGLRPAVPVGMLSPVLIADDGSANRARAKAWAVAYINIIVIGGFKNLDTVFYQQRTAYENCYNYS